MSWKKRPEAALYAALLLASPAVAAEAPSSVIMTIPEDGSAIDVRPVAELLLRHGAPITLSTLPTGRIAAVMKESAPVCGMAFIRNLAERPGFQWIARTASVDFVAAGLTEGEEHAADPRTTAVVAMNTLSQSIAAKAGYTVLPIKTLNQAVPLLQSGRAGVLVAARQEVEKLSAAGSVALPEEKVLAHGEAWMACNKAVQAPDIERIAGAWSEVAASGELRDLYAKAGILGLYPEN